jgi:hypothetical protein
MVMILVTPLAETPGIHEGSAAFPTLDSVKKGAMPGDCRERQCRKPQFFGIFFAPPSPLPMASSPDTEVVLPYTYKVHELLGRR